MGLCLYISVLFYTLIASEPSLTSVKQSKSVSDPNRYFFRTVVHYAQGVNSDDFMAYDHGKKENLVKALKKTFLQKYM